MYVLGVISPAYCCGAQVLILFSMFFFAKPRQAVLLFIFIRPTLDCLKTYTDIKLQMTSSVNLAGIMGMLIVAWGIVYFLSHRINPFHSPCSLRFAAFLAASFFAVFPSPLRTEGFFDWTRLITIFMLYLLVYHLMTTKQHIRQLVIVVCCSAVVPLLAGFHQAWAHSGLIDITEYEYMSGYHRIFGTFTHPAMYSFYLTVLLPVGIVLFLESKTRFEKTALGIFSVALGISLLLTLTRSAWIGLFCALFIIGTLRYRRLLFILVIIIVAAAYIMPQASQRFVDLLDPYAQQTSSFTWRVRLWTSALGVFMEGPLLLGHGLGSFGSFAERVLGYYAEAHNDYIRVVWETGLLGFILYMCLLFGLVTKAFFTYRTLSVPHYKGVALGFFALCIAYLVISMSDNLLRGTVVQIYFWTFAAAVFNLRRIEHAAQEGSVPQTG